MKYLTLLFASLFLSGCDASVSLMNPKNNSAINMHSAGEGYLDSVKAALDKKDLLACEWEDDYPGVDDDGAGYKEGQAAAEDADCHEGKEDE